VLSPDGVAEAVAINGETIVAVGSDDEIDALRAPSTRVIDLAGRLAIPAFGDAHVHAIGAGLESLRCNLLGLRTRHECLDAIAAYAATLPEGAWVLGGGWSIESFPGGLPTTADLDAASGGRPAFLPTRDHHAAWVSSAALEIAGVDELTPDPFSGRIERDEHRRPTGVLHDGAMRLVARHLPPTSPEELAGGLRAALARLHALGITHWQDACVGDAGDIGVVDTYDAYAAAARERWLSARVRGALWWDRAKGLEQVTDLLTRREASPTGQFRATSVKMMVDGVCETFTAAMSRAYLTPEGEAGHRGDLFIEEDLLAEAVGALDAEDFQVHFHAIGDRAITTTLDALEALGSSRWGRNRHHIAHLQFIAPDDLDRFARVGAIATFQPLWACSDPQMEEFTIPVVGEERANWQYSIGSLWERHARVAFGSDWPVSSPDPIQEIHVAVNRMLSPVFGRPHTEETTVAFRPDQAITVTQALEAFTRNVAYVNGDEDLLGVLAPGRRADVAVLSQDLLHIAPADIGATVVDLTVAGGGVVHGDE
jgi:hypothetical protein